MQIPDRAFRSIRAKFSALKRVLVDVSKDLPADRSSELNAALTSVELAIFAFDVPPAIEYALTLDEGGNGWIVQVHAGDRWRPLDGTIHETVVEAANAIPGASPIYPAWIQPTGAHDAYAAGAKVTHGANNWESLIDGNVWEPGAVGSESLWKAI